MSDHQHHHHFHLPGADETTKLLREILAKQETIMATLADIQAQNKALQDAVAAEDKVVNSAVVLINGFTGQLSDLQSQLAAAIAANDPTAIQAVSDSMAATVTDVTTNTAALATAVAAGTGAPQTPPTVPVAPTPPVAPADTTVGGAGTDSTSGAAANPPTA